MLRTVNLHWENTWRTRCGISKVVPLDSWNFEKTFAMHLLSSELVKRTSAPVLCRQNARFRHPRACRLPLSDDAIPPDHPAFESFAYVLQLHSRRRRSFLHPAAWFWIHPPCSTKGAADLDFRGVVDPSDHFIWSQKRSTHTTSLSIPICFQLSFTIEQKHKLPPQAVLFRHHCLWICDTCVLDHRKPWNPSKSLKPCCLL